MAARRPSEVRLARRERPTVWGMAGAGTAVIEAVMEAVQALAGALAARETNEATALKQ